MEKNVRIADCKRVFGRVHNYDFEFIVRSIVVVGKVCKAYDEAYFTYKTAKNE